MRLSPKEAFILVVVVFAAVVRGPHPSPAYTVGQATAAAALVGAGIYLNRKRKSHT